MADGISINIWAGGMTGFFPGIFPVWNVTYVFRGVRWAGGPPSPLNAEHSGEFISCDPVLMIL